jgi:hypothetical protein
MEKCELLMFIIAGGQRIAATVSHDATIGHVIKEYSRMAQANESEVCILFKVGSQDPNL